MTSETNDKEYCLTTGLITYLSKYASLHGPSLVEHFTTLVENELEYWISYLGRLPAGAERAKIVHSLIDSYLKEPGALLDGIKCLKGCSFCCHFYVGVTTDEADLLRQVAILSEVGRDRLSMQLNWGIGDYGGQSKENSACVLLSPDGLCTVYEHRPAACRKHFVTSDPDLCAKTGNVDISIGLRAEIIASAALNVCGGGSQSLAHAVEDGRHREEAGPPVQ